MPLALSLWLALAPVDAVPLGKVPPAITLDGDLGGRVDGRPWSSKELAGKPFIVFYVDPDESEVNEHIGPALRDAKVDIEEFVAVAVINMDATWLPNWVIQGKLEESQKEFPRTVYVRDDDKVLVKKWGFADDSYSIAIFDARGKCVWSKDGRHSKADTTKVVDIMLKQTGQR